MDREEGYQQETTKTFTNVTIALERINLRLDTLNEKHESVAASMHNIIDPEQGVIRRLQVIEDSMSRATTLAKWFFSGGLITLVTSIVFMYELMAHFR